MKIHSNLSDIDVLRIQKIILVGGSLTTLVFWTTLEDPFNLPKMCVLLLFAVVAFGYALPELSNFRKNTSKYYQNSLLLVLLFIIGILTSTLVSDQKYTAIFGEFHRNNGALTLLASALIAVASAAVFRNTNSGDPLKYFSYLGVALSFYGLLQFTGKDPINWSNQYNPVITTLGNPNFTSGLLGILSIGILFLVFEAKKLTVKILYFVILVGSLFVMLKSDSVQGIFAFLLGVAILITLKFWLTNRTFGNLFGLSILLAGIPLVMAIFNRGPFASFLYQNTLRNRLDYWHAAWNMFQSNPIFGVGIDRFGEYYREYAVQNQVAQGVFTNNAHNVYLHTLATGGLVLFIPFVILLIYITYLAVRDILHSPAKEKLHSATYLAIWLAYLILNIVTIENIGVGVWFWITGGVIIGRSANEKLAEKSLKVKKNQSFQSLLNNRGFTHASAPFVLGIIAIVICAPQLKNSADLLALKSKSNSIDDSSYMTHLTKEVHDNQDNPQILIILADLALQRNNVSVARAIAKKATQIDKRSYYGIYLQALSYEMQNKRAAAIPFRERLLIIDKWNTENMLQLVKTYVNQNEIKKAENISVRLSLLFPQSEDAAKATYIISRTR